MKLTFEYTTLHTILIYYTLHHTQEFQTKLLQVKP